MLENIGPYFLRDTFDPADILAAAAGAVIGWLVVGHFRGKGGLS
jgi:hypothetical protein